MPQNKIVELTELRGENEKHFALPDGTVEAVSYGKAIHRQNSEVEWVDINNDLTLKTVNSKRLYSTEDGRVSLYMSGISATTLSARAELGNFKEQLKG
jgi:hypothetical protein